MARRVQRRNTIVWRRGNLPNLKHLLYEIWKRMDVGNFASSLLSLLGVLFIFMARSWSDVVRATTRSLFYASLQTVKAQSRRRAAAAAAAAAAALLRRQTGR